MRERSPLPPLRPASSETRKTRPGPGSERQAHHDRVPQLAARTTVLAYSPALLGEAGRAVQRDRGRIVRESLQTQLVQPLVAGPVDRRLHQRRAHAAAAPAAADQDGQFAETVAADLDVDQSDDLAARDGDDRRVRAARAHRRPLLDVDWRL